MTIQPKTTDDSAELQNAVRLASVDLVPQADGRVTLAITLSPAASAMLRAYQASSTTPAKPAAKARRKPKPDAGAQGEPRVKRPRRAKPAASKGLLGSIAAGVLSVVNG